MVEASPSSRSFVLRSIDRRLWFCMHDVSGYQIRLCQVEVKDCVYFILQRVINNIG